VAERVTELRYDTDGNLEYVIDPLHVTELGHDAASRVDLLIRPDLETAQFGHDANGNRSALTPPGRPVHGFDFTKVDQERLYVPPPVPGGGSTTTQYNLDRRLDAIVRPDGSVLDFDDDAAGRLDTLDVPGRGVIDYAYSPVTGQLSGISTPEGSSLALGYDGFLLATQTWSGPVAGTVARPHNDELLVESETVTGSTVSFDYDDDDLLVSAGALALVPDVHHGLLRTTALGGVATNQDYSAFGELSMFEAVYASSLLYREEILTRDKLGRIVDRRETVGGVATDYRYEYDTAGRLWKVFVNSQLETEYGYHPNGSRTSRTAGAVTAGSFDAQERIETWGALAFTHTPNGERLTKTDTATAQTTTYTTDALGNLLRVVLPAGPTIDYVIDGLNRRIGKKHNGTLVQGFLYRDLLEPIAELDGAGQLVSRFVYASKPHVPDYMLKGGQTYRIVSDHLGSVRLVVNVADGSIAQRIDYDEFGRVTLDTNAGFQPFGFAGGLYDADTGLVRFGARDYDPETGRWTAKDPIAFAGGGPEPLRVCAQRSGQSRRP
jgi:RHS repeat-associated protein